MIKKKITTLGALFLFAAAFGFSSCAKKGTCPAYGTHVKHKGKMHASIPAPTEHRI